MGMKARPKRELRVVASEPLIESTRTTLRYYGFCDTGTYHFVGTEECLAVVETDAGEFFALDEALGDEGVRYELWVQRHGVVIDGRLWKWNGERWVGRPW